MIIIYPENVDIEGLGALAFLLAIKGFNHNTIVVLPDNIDRASEEATISLHYHHFTKMIWFSVTTSYNPPIILPKKSRTVIPEKYKVGHKRTKK